MRKFSLMSAPLQKDFDKVLRRTRATIDNSLSYDQSKSQLATHDQSRTKQRRQISSFFVQEQVKEFPLPFSYIQMINENINKQKQMRTRNLSKQQVNKKQKEQKMMKQYLEFREDSFRRGKELKERLELLMAYDNQKSNPKNLQEEKFPDGYWNIGFPLINCATSKLPLGQENLSIQSSQCVYGLLNQIGFCFYAIDNIVYFQDLVDKVKYHQQQREAKLQKVQFGNKVLSIKQGQFKSVRFSDNDRVFFIEYPDSMSICKYHLNGRQIVVRQDKMLIGQTFKQSHIYISKSKRVFYLTRFGQLVEVIQCQLPKWKNMFTNRNYYIETQKYDEKIQDFIKRGLSGSFSQTFRYFGKYIKSSVQSLFKRVQNNMNKQIISSAFNDNQKMVSCLVTTGFGIVFKCFSFKEDQIKCILVLDERQVCRQLDIKRQMRYLSKSTKLDIPDNSYQQANLLLVLENGHRIYIRISQDCLTKIGEVSPPSIDSFYDNFNNDFFKPIPIRSQKTQYSFQKMISYKSCKKSTFMSFIGAESSQLYSCILNKQFFFKNETMSTIQFSVLGYGSQYKGDTTYRSCPQFSCLPRTLMTNRSYNIVYKLQEQNMESHRVKTQQLHELASQVHFDPWVFVFGNSKGTELKYKMRFIDIMFFLVFAQNINVEDIQNYFQKLSKKYMIHPSQIASMLLQILTNKKGVYRIQTKFVKNFLSQTLKQKTRRDFLRFQDHRQQTIRLTHSDLISRMWKKIDLLLSGLSRMDYYDSIFKIMIDLNELSVESLDAFYHLNNQPKQEGVLLYFARVVRPLWYVPLRDIQIHLQQLQQLFERVEQVFQYIKVREIGTYRSSEKSKIQLTFKELIQRVFQIFEVCKIFVEVPNLSFSECLYATSESFQQYIILTIIKGQNMEEFKKQFKKISYFISTSTYKAIQLYLEFNNFKTLEQIYQKTRQYESIPFYIYNYLLKYRDFPQDIPIRTRPCFDLPKQQIVVQQTQASPFQLLNANINKLLKQLEEKKSMKVSEGINIPSRQQQIIRIETQIRALYVQNVLLFQERDKSIYIDQETVRRLKQDVLTEVEIRSLVMSLESKLADVIFVLNFSKVLESNLILELMFEELDQENKKKELIKRIKYLINNTYECHRIFQLLLIFIDILCQHHASQKPFINFFGDIVDEELSKHANVNKNGKKEMEYKIQIFWIAYTLFQLGYTIELIEEGLFASIEQKLYGSFDHKYDNSKYSPLKIYSLVLTYVYYLKFISPKLINQRKQFLQNVMNSLREIDLLDTGETQRLVEHINNQLKEQSNWSK